MKQSTFSQQLSNFFELLKKNYAKSKTKEHFPMLFFTFCGLLLFVPTFFVSKNAFEKSKRLSQAELLINQLEVRAKKTALHRNNESNFFERLNKAEENLALEELEKKNFLQKEKSALKRLLHEPLFAENSTLIERKKEISENHLSFIAEKEIVKGEIKESYFTQQQEVEMDREDLKAFLASLEDAKDLSRSPQITVKNFSLEKKKLTTDYETYKCRFDFIQRTVLKDAK